MRTLLRSALGLGVSLSFVGSSLVAQANTYVGHPGTGETTVTKTELTRVAGTTRAGTAVEASKLLYPTDHTSKYAILVNEDKEFDALAAGPFAKMKDAPILLTDAGTLTSATATELDRVLKTSTTTMSAQTGTGTSPAATVFIIGGTGAVSTAVEDAVKALRDDIDTERITGATRYDTACALADKMDSIRGSTATKGYLVSGENSADSVVAATYAANKTLNGEHSPIFLTSDTELPQCVVNYLTQHGVKPATGESTPVTPSLQLLTIIGGEVRVPTALENQAKTLVATVLRITGSNRFHTAANAAETYFGEFNKPSAIGVARGDSPFDALAASVVLAKDNAPLLLVLPESLPFETEAYLNGHASTIKKGKVFGGESAVSAEVIDAIQDIYMGAV